MKQAADDFVSWATDPTRTNDELFTVELLIDQVRGWPQWPFHDRALPFDEEMLQQKERKFQPGYRPSLALDEIKALQERADTIVRFGGAGTNDRSLRDLQALRFFPALNSLDLNGSDVADLSPLAALPRVQRFSIGEYGDFVGAHDLDFAVCGEKPALTHLSFSLRQPWPDLRALAHWPALQDVVFSGNILAFAEVEALPAAVAVKINAWMQQATPLRDLRVFPAMPLVKRLNLYQTVSLNGIERYPTVVNLELGGTFVDLTPLTALADVTYLKLKSENFTDLTPLTRMPKLRELVLVRERPLDLSPLTDAPQLRRVTFERCAIMRMELAALNAGLLPEAEDFVAAEPRPLAPLKFYLQKNDNEAAKKYFLEYTQTLRATRAKFYNGDLALEQAEARSFLTNLHAQLNALLGRGWGVANIFASSSAGQTLLNFKRYIDTTRIREIIQLLRELSAQSRLPWHYLVMVEPHADMSYELEQLQDLEDKAKEPEGHWLARYFEPEAVLEENKEGERRHREKYELLEREHLYHLQQQQGGAPDSDLLEPPPDDDVEDEEDLFEDEELEEPLSASASDEEDQEGGVALAPPPPAPPDTEDLSDQLSYAINVYEDCIVVAEGWLDRARYGLGEAPVEWTTEAS